MLAVSVILSIILGAVAAGLTGSGILFLVVSIFVFICSLPFALIGGHFQKKDKARIDEEYHREMAKIEREERELKN